MNTLNLCALDLQNRVQERLPLGFKIFNLKVDLDPRKFDKDSTPYYIVTFEYTYCDRHKYASVIYKDINDPSIAKDIAWQVAATPTISDCQEED